MGLFVELSVFICYLDLRIIGLVRLRTGRVRVHCEIDHPTSPLVPRAEGRSSPPRDAHSNEPQSTSTSYSPIFLFNINTCLQRRDRARNAQNPPIDTSLPSPPPEEEPRAKREKRRYKRGCKSRPQSFRTPVLLVRVTPVRRGSRKVS